MSDGLYGDDVSWLATGLTNVQLRHIGLITIVWNTAEFDVQGLVRSLAGWRPWQAALVTADLGNVSRVQLALNLLRQTYKHPRLVGDVERSVLFFDECRKSRNALVHGTAVMDDAGNLTGMLARFDTKQAKGTVKVSRLNCTNEYLLELLSDLWLCRMALTDADRKVMRFRRLADDPSDDDLLPDAEKEVFEYSESLLDTAHLQSRLDQLRSRPPIQSKQLSPPPPSEA